MSTNRQNISSGSPREPVLGYSRAVRVGNLVFVAGTTSGGIGEDAESQTREIFTRISKALEQAGASYEDVVRTRVYLTHLARDFDAVGAVHGEIFGEIRPVTATIGVSELASPDVLVEVEVDAVLA
ncbi:enamine deaminase RidA (YjgF/YER057c/UK114 family) [Motilibacter rhizosphaerae]|uniref:Enamine deaminase RidA (YjgF/YER057c/UK114 family) n=1 Tax=Motilibacter rhizosphaerae TaxID=598652 RepID=A0A4Q7N753_9ACTN|nr:RidA family protein [Motilibacter rhizosphaerae]RZS77534.1 enamine deaminase RidA (YjgF/YER057c/UK114 family) [Motilibacter rhizosphaerae]